MSRTKLTVTQSWQSAFTGPGLVTVEETGEGVLLINDAESDITALAIKATDGPRMQIDQRSTVETFIRATGDGWEVIIDIGD